MKIAVRRAVPADARAIAEVHVQCWRESFGHLVPIEDLDRVSVDQRERRWNEILPFPWANIWVVTDRKKIVGFAGSSENREPTVEAKRQIQALHVLKKYYDTTAEQQLLDAVLAKDETAVLWVADDSPRAHAFYARNGFEPDGANKLGPVAGTDVLQARLVRSARD